MTKFVPDHIKSGYEESTEETYADVPGVFVDDEEDNDSDVFVETGEYIPKSDAERSIIREITGILTDVGLDLDEIGEYVKEIDYSLPRVDIINAFKKFAKTDLCIKHELDCLYPVFTELAKPRVISDIRVKTTADIVEGGTPGGVPVSFPSDRVTKDRKLKPEHELPQLVTSDALRSKYVKKMMEGKEVTCKLCGQVIDTDEVRTWWLSIYPAHIECVHTELNRRAISAGRPLPFPE